VLRVKWCTVGKSVGVPSSARVTRARAGRLPAYRSRRGPEVAGLCTGQALSHSKAARPKAATRRLPPNTVYYIARSIVPESPGEESQQTEMPPRRAARSPARRRAEEPGASQLDDTGAASSLESSELDLPPPLQRSASEEALYQAREDDALCPICLDVLTCPVSLMCGHNVCRYCLIEHLEVTNGTTACPSGCPAVPIRVPHVNLSLQVLLPLPGAAARLASPSLPQELHPAHSSTKLACCEVT
jgi:hypothetical protein